jgi:CheY-like chemotaxis protein
MVKKILVVDDEEILLETIKAVLKHAGFEVITASDGEECMDVLKKQKEVPDLILMDMMMPGMSGRETTELIRKDPELKDLKIIFLTVARFSEIGKKTLEELGVLDYITKPFENADLVSRLKKAVGE